LNLVPEILITFGSSAPICFGVWHFFVPGHWKWYSYVDNNAHELVAAIRAINVLFSLSLVLFGIVDLLLIYSGHSNHYSVCVVIGATCILWIVRLVLHFIYPQGSIFRGLQYAMLSVFILVTLAYLISVVLLLRQNVIA
jgi:hypothetical protein